MNLTLLTLSSYSKTIRGVIRLSTICGIACGFLSVWPVDILAQQTDENVENIRRDWIARQEKTRSFRYSLSGTDLLPKGKMIEAGDPELAPGQAPQPEQDLTTLFKMTWEWDLTTSQFNKVWNGEIFNVSECKLFPRVLKYVVNNGVVQSLRGIPEGHHRREDAGPPHLVIYSASQSGGFVSASDYAVTLAHGMFLTEDWSLLGDVKDVSAKSLELRLAERARHNGRECVVIDITRSQPKFRQLRDRVWVDVARQSAILKWERYFNERLFVRLNINYQDTAFGWLPHDWTADYYVDLPESPLDLTAHHSVRVDDVSVNGAISAEALRIPMQPGYIVSDSRDNQKQYRIAADGKTHLSLHQTEWRIGIAEILWLISSLLLAGIVGVVIFRKWMDRCISSAIKWIGKSFRDC